MRVAVAGGGIAGLTAAIALAARGHSVDLFERAAQLRRDRRRHPAFAERDGGPRAARRRERSSGPALRAGSARRPRCARSGASWRGCRSARARESATARPIARCTAPTCRPRSSLPRAAGPRSSSISAPKSATSARTEGGVAFAAGGHGRRSDILIGADGIRSRVRTGFFRHPGAEAARSHGLARDAAVGRRRRFRGARLTGSGSERARILCITRSAAGHASTSSSSRYGDARRAAAAAFGAARAV